MDVIKFLYDNWFMTIIFLWVVFSGTESCILAAYKYRAGKK